ncbi:hypothetical protein L4D76_24135 [Photobacterium sagamiensis]|uniref:hypothetical protein n=1 Tax=Photobacterium sagamiensis TaxID=2910241 RepID=UPI003D0CDE1E
MQLSQPYSAFAKKQMKIQFTINFVLNGLFTWVAFQAAQETLYIPIGGMDSMLQDLLVTNFFLCSCVFFFVHADAKKFLVKESLSGHWINKDSDMLKYINKFKPVDMTMKKAIFKIFFKAGIVVLILMGIMSLITPEAGIPWYGYWAFKVAYACTLAIIIARGAVAVGTVNPQSINA